MTDERRTIAGLAAAGAIASLFGATAATAQAPDATPTQTQAAEPTPTQGATATPAPASTPDLSDLPSDDLGEFEVQTDPKLERSRPKAKPRVTTKPRSKRRKRAQEDDQPAAAECATTDAPNAKASGRDAVKLTRLSVEEADAGLSPEASEQQRLKAERAAAKAAKRELRRAQAKAAAAAQCAADQAREKKQARAAKADPRLRRPDGTPKSTNPTFSLALPGAAPIGVPNFFIEKFRIPPFLLPIYQAAGMQYGVRWEVLAAINEIETDYGRNLNVSSAGAVGWMQFLPSTWKLYGVDGNRDGKTDPYNPVDAIFAAARYLRAAGADTDLKQAIFAYNHADWYVDSVLLRAQLIGGLPANLLGSLTGLTQGEFPVAAKARYADDLSEARATVRLHKGAANHLIGATKGRRGINIYARAGAPVVAVNDGRVLRIGVTERLGRFVQIQDEYGNTFTYGHLKKVAPTYAAPRSKKLTQAQIRRELQLPAKDPAPQAPASAAANGQPGEAGKPGGVGPSGPSDAAVAPAAAPATSVPKVTAPKPSDKRRLFAHPLRPHSLAAGADRQLAGTKYDPSRSVAGVKLSARDFTVRPLREGARVTAGTVLGRIGRTSADVAPHALFEIRPAGRGAPRIDPKPILDGWKLLESTALYRAKGRNALAGADAKPPSIGQILLMGKAQLQDRVLANPRIDMYSCGRRDVRLGLVDRRVLATLEYLAASGLRPTVTSLRCGHSFYTSSGNVSHHSSGNAADIAAVNGIPILGHQGAGSITEITIQRLLTLQGSLRPTQIISLMTVEGADNTLALPDHADHIHVGFQPLFGTNSQVAKQVSAILAPSQWNDLIERLAAIKNPSVPRRTSRYAIRIAPRPARASSAHEGE